MHSVHEHLVVLARWFCRDGIQDDKAQRVGPAFAACCVLSHRCANSCPRMYSKTALQLAQPLLARRCRGDMVIMDVHLESTGAEQPFAVPAAGLRQLV